MNRGMLYPRTADQCGSGVRVEFNWLVCMANQSKTSDILCNGDPAICGLGSAMKRGATAEVIHHVKSSTHSAGAMAKFGLANAPRVSKPLKSGSVGQSLASARCCNWKLRVGTRVLGHRVARLQCVLIRKISSSSNSESPKGLCQRARALPIGVMRMAMSFRRWDALEPTRRRARRNRHRASVDFLLPFVGASALGQRDSPLNLAPLWVLKVSVFVDSVSVRSELLKSISSTLGGLL
jgi:hypothetical protein